MEADSKMREAIAALAKARNAFAAAVEQKLILGNDNHIGDIGEYWVRKHFEQSATFKEFAPKKNAPYDLELMNGTRLSVKTITSWSKTGYGTQVKPLCGTDWQALAAVFLDEQLYPSKIAVVPLSELLLHEPFVSNSQRRESKETSAFPRFQWWPWLDRYNVYGNA